MSNMNCFILVKGEFPRGCGNCEFASCTIFIGRDNANVHCLILHDDFAIDSLTVTRERPDFCPLRQLPDKKYVRDGDDALATFYKNGWNDCLEAIEGSGEDG